MLRWSGCPAGSRITSSSPTTCGTTSSCSAPSLPAVHDHHELPGSRLFKPLAAEKKRTDGNFIFLYPGTLNHHQGVDIAIKAFALVKDGMPNAELHIYGEGPADRSS